MNEIKPIILLFLFLILGCIKSPNDPEYHKEITVFGYLWGHENLNEEHAIFVGYTKPVTDYYKIEDAAIQGAQVSVTEELSETVFTLNESESKSGFYYHDSLWIEPNKTYYLKIIVDDTEVIASTTVPSDLEITTELKRDTINIVHYRNLAREKPVFLECEDPEQIVLVDMYCKESYESVEYIRTFMGHTHPDDQEEYDGGYNGEPRHIQGMGRIFEFTSDHFPGYYVVDWYSAMIVFYGLNRMQIMAIDDNYHQFLHKENPALNGGIQGGIGCFGSMVGETFELDVIKD